MNYCLACRSIDVKTKEVQLVRVDIRTNQRKEYKRINEISCNACGYQFSDELDTSPALLAAAI